jgi:hypothetical protein
LEYKEIKIVKSEEKCMINQKIDQLASKID